MANPLYGAMGGVPNIMQLLQQLKTDPAGVLMQCRWNVPADLRNDPQAMVQHLLKTGQVSQAQVNQSYQVLQRMGRK